MLRAKEILEASWWNWMVFLSFFFLFILGSFYYHVASRFMIRFECKEYQSRNIPPLVYLGFFPPPSEMVFILFILSVVPGNTIVLRWGATGALKKCWCSSGLFDVLRNQGDILHFRLKSSQSCLVEFARRRGWKASCSIHSNRYTCIFLSLFFKTFRNIDATGN